MTDEYLFWREHYKRPPLSGYVGGIWTLADHDYEVMDDDGNIVTKHWSMSLVMEQMRSTMKEIRETPSPFWQTLEASAKDATHKKR